MTEASKENGIMVNSGQFNGMKNEDAKKAIVDYLAEKGMGEMKVNFRLRDWLISRQRFWGAPIPIIYCDHCGTAMLPLDLDILLPSMSTIPWVSKFWNGSSTLTKPISYSIWKSL